MQGKEKVTNRNVKWSTKTFKAISAVHINNNTYYMPLFLSDYFCFPGVMCIYIYTRFSRRYKPRNIRDICNPWFTAKKKAQTNIILSMHYLDSKRYASFSYFCLYTFSLSYTSSTNTLHSETERVNAYISVSHHSSIALCHFQPKSEFLHKKSNHWSCSMQKVCTNPKLEKTKFILYKIKEIKIALWLISL